MLFEQIDAPAAHSAFSRRQDARWFSWSRYFRQELTLFRKQLNGIARPELIYIKRYKDYNYTYSVELSRVDKYFIEDFRHFALALYHFDPGGHLNFFTGLIDDKITDAMYHKITALMRAILAAGQKDPMAALYTPLTPGKDQSDFPLHCDLYIPQTLFNVFGQVAADGSGHSIFLQLEKFFSLLDAVGSMPVEVKNRIKGIFTSALRRDHYEEFYGLLYNEGNPWRAELKKALTGAKLSIGFQKGEGYMINDRVWMHGRDRTNGGISRKRLHRLVFTNIYQYPHRYKK